MTESSKEFVCGDCGADLLWDEFVSSVCGYCGGLNPQTRQDYQAYADATQTEDDARLVADNTIDGVVLTDGDAWLQCGEPADTQANL